MNLEKLQREAERGCVKAQYWLGWMHYRGCDIEDRNMNLAVKWIEKAAKQGHAGAQYQIGKMYYEGVGVERSDAEAFKWWRMLPKTNPCDVVRWLEEEELRERLGC